VSFEIAKISLLLLRLLRLLRLLLLLLLSRTALLPRRRGLARGWSRATLRDESAADAVLVALLLTATLRAVAPVLVNTWRGSGQHQHRQKSDEFGHRVLLCNPHFYFVPGWE
jgi:Na+/serine symporter